MERCILDRYSNPPFRSIQPHWLDRKLCRSPSNNSDTITLKTLEGVK